MTNKESFKIEGSSSEVFSYLGQMIDEISEELDIDPDDLILEILGVTIRERSSEDDE